MGKSIVTVRRFVGLDVHAETIFVAMAEKDGEVRSLGTIPNREHSIRKLLSKLSGSGALVDSWCGVAQRDPFPAPPFKLCMRVSRTQLTDEFS